MLIQVVNSQQKQEGEAEINSCFEVAEFFAHIVDFGFMAAVGSCSHESGYSCQRCCSSFGSFILDCHRRDRRFVEHILWG